FDSPTPSSGWTFVLGDIDADMLRISAVTATGAPATATDLGFRSGFNYCAPGTTGKPSCTGDPLDVPSWDPSTLTLTGNTAAADTSGAAAWFEPNVALESLTFNFTARSGLPIYQTWFASIARDVGGVVADPDGVPEVGATLELFDTNGALAATTTTDATGAYSFTGFTAADGYTVELTTPNGKAVIGSSRTPVDISDSDALDVDFTVRELGGAQLSGQARNTFDIPLGGIEIILEDQDGTRVVITTDSSGNYQFDPVAAGTYTVTASTPAGYSPQGSAIAITIPPDSELPVDNLDFVFAQLSSLSGIVTIGGEPAAGIPVEIKGPDGKSTITTDVDGRYAADGLAGGSYTLTIAVADGTYAIGETTREIEIENDGTTITDANFELGREGSIGGRVSDPTGSAIPGSLITLTRDIDTTELTSAADGGFTAGKLPAGQYELTLTVPDGYLAASPTSQEVSISTAGENVTDVNFEVVLDSEGVPTVPAPGEPGEPTIPEPGNPTIPEPGQPTMPEPGEPTVPEPGQPTVPNPGEPTVPEPGDPSVPTPGTPSVPEPGEPGDPEPEQPPVPENVAPAVPDTSESTADAPVVPGSAVPSGGTLASTGQEVSPPVVAFASASVLLGVLAMWIARRRRSFPRGTTRRG
ncbi:MAG: putative collagen-binding protein, partial [Glaciihabitans sp.]|nr:putative collagen-binding protein [Glaciihabitans sp.]